MKLGSVFKKKIDQYKKDKVKLAAPTTNESKFKKDKLILLVVSATFFDQHQFTVIQVDLDHTDISDENLVKVIELSIKSSDECHEWYLNLYVLTHFINNKLYFKSYRLINNFTASIVTSDLFLKILK
jgi:hypothetical protein